MKEIRLNGKKLYPVGSFQRHQHIFFNHNDRCYNRMHDEDYSDSSVTAFDESEHFLDVVTNQVYNGMIYACYEDYKKMKDIIGAYAIRHNGNY